MCWLWDTVTPARYYPGSRGLLHFGGIPTPSQSIKSWYLSWCTFYSFISLKIRICLRLPRMSGYFSLIYIYFFYRDFYKPSMKIFLSSSLIDLESVGWSVQEGKKLSIPNMHYCYFITILWFDLISGWQFERPGMSITFPCILFFHLFLISFLVYFFIGHLVTGS